MPEMTPSDGLVWMIEVGWSGLELKHFRLPPVASIDFPLCVEEECVLTFHVKYDIRIICQYICTII